MAISINKAIILGNATRDPEVRVTPNGRSVANFGVATNRRWKNQDGQIQEDTQFHDVVVWGKLAEIIGQIVKKGTKIYVEGRLQTRSWQAPDNSKRYRTEIVMENFVPMSPRSDEAQIAADQPSQQDVPLAKGPQEPKTAKSKDQKSLKDQTPSADGDPDAIDLDEIPF